MASSSSSSSSCHLAVGSLIAGTSNSSSFDEVQRRFFIYNNSQGRADFGKVKHRDRTRLRLVCSGRDASDYDCACRINAVPVVGAEGDVAKITIANLNHTCTQESGRTRKVKAALVQSLAGDMLSSYIPGGVARGGDPQQLISMVHKTTGYTMGYQMAQRSIKAAKNDTVSCAVKEFKLLGSYFTALQEQDEGGTYELFTNKNEAGEDIFVSFYVAPSFSKEFWNHCRRVVVVDGTHVSTILGGILLLLCCKDANNQNVVLAFSYTDKENLVSYKRFFRRTSVDFPGPVVVIADGDKGCSSALASTWKDATLSRCFKHLIDNYHTHHPGDQIRRESILPLLYAMARATTDELWDYLIKKLVATDGEVTERIAKWMLDRREDVGALTFNKLGLSRYDDLLNNPCEQTNGVLLTIRSLPVLRMVRALLQDVIYKHGFIRKEAGKKWVQEKKVFTPWADEVLVRERVASRNFTIRILEATESVVRADATSLSESLFTYNCELRQSTTVSDTAVVCVCTCRKMWDTQRPCKHVVAVFEYLVNTMVSSKWNGRDTKWYGGKAVYCVEAYVRQYSGHIPSVSVAEILDQDNLLPWEVPIKAGRPKKARMFKGDGAKRKRECQACGRDGHYSNTCPRAETKRLVEMDENQRRPLKLGYTIDLTE